MKTTYLILAAGLAAALVTGCASDEATLRTKVGPTPAVSMTSDSDGILKVFTAKEKEDDVGFAFPHNERTDYYIYDAQGHEVKATLHNNKGEFEAVPRGVSLAPGNYKVKALAAVGLGEWVTVPVVIQAGRTTEVHLNGQWRAPSGTPGNELVYSPSGFPMGWKVGE